MTIDTTIFEAVMLLCFGSSWPFAVSKTIRTKSVEGKSLIFLCLIFLGYVSGVIYKITTNFDHVIWIYCLNGSLVFTEIVLYCKYQSPGKSSVGLAGRMYDAFYRLICLRKPALHSD